MDFSLFPEGLIVRIGDDRGVEAAYLVAFANQFRTPKV
jgi:hypothetical protein